MARLCVAFDIATAALVRNGWRPGSSLLTMAPENQVVAGKLMARVAQVADRAKPLVSRDAIIRARKEPL